jgi:hypothetical protein
MGKAFSDAHCFIVDGSGEFMADISGDQFGYPEAYLCPLDGSDYEVHQRFDIGHKSMAEHERNSFVQWRGEWQQLSATYLAEAAAILEEYQPARVFNR